MERNNPLVSIIIATFNRPKTIRRAIESILRQTYNNFEIIIIDDQATYNVAEVIKKYDDPRIRLIRHLRNKGNLAAKNTGFNNIRGEWFTILDDDDEMLADALETMIKVLSETNETIDEITCNCIDAITGEFTGKGLNKDQYLDAGTVILKCKGEHWGLTKTSLLGNDRFNEDSENENTLWYKINERARGYYIHKGLRIYHTEGYDRITKAHAHYDNKQRAKMYIALKDELQYLSILKRYNPNEFGKLCLKGSLYLTAANKKNDAKYYYSMMEQGRSNIYYKIAAKMTILIGPWMAIGIIKFIGILKSAKNTIKRK